MASVACPRPGLDPENHPISNAHPDCDCLHHQAQSIVSNTTSPLGEIIPNRLHHIPRPGTIESLTAELENFHIHSPAKASVGETPGKESLDRKRLLVDPTDHEQLGHKGNTLPDLFVARKQLNSEDPQRRHEPSALRIASQQIPPHTEQLSKVQAGQFDWILSVLTPDDFATERRSRNSFLRGRPPLQGGQRLRFGCNLLHRGAQSTGDSNKVQPANIYTLIATRIDGDEYSFPPARPLLVHDTTYTPAAEVTDIDTTVVQLPGARRATTTSRRTSEIAMTGKNDDIVEQIISLPPAQQSSRIEDSVEALDKLEDDLEVLHLLSREETKNQAPGSLDNVPVPVTAAPKAPIKRREPTARTGAVCVKSVDRSLAFRKSTSSTSSMEGEKQAASAKATPAKSRLTRPVSLLPPKPLAKSSKQPTVPVFELPGEAVARRLKEQREARRSLQISSEQAAAVAEFFSPSRPHAKSTKKPTIPTFELPGEAISRRKREEREARLRAQEEEERKRREFKARPIRSSIAPSGYPRGTIASRARQSIVFQPDGSPEAPSPNKRQSVVRSSSLRVAGSPSRPSTSTGTVRGRTSNQGLPPAAELSRATSTSTGSTHGSTSGKRSNMSSEDSSQQRLRGKDIYKRDNIQHAERERERRDREEATRLARQQAAERSRQLSREWAEKQRAKASAAKMPSLAATKAY